MKLARVTHIHCHHRDWDDPATYVWVDDLMTAEEFESFAEAAQAAYDKAGTDFQEAERPPAVQWGMPDYHKFPDRTVAEVKAEHDAKHEQYEAWNKRKRAAQADFAHHLKAVGNGRIIYFFDQKPALEFGLNWGHRHGNRAALGETEISDLHGLVEREEWP